MGCPTMRGSPSLPSQASGTVQQRACCGNFVSCQNRLGSDSESSCPLQRGPRPRRSAMTFTSDGSSGGTSEAMPAGRSHGAKKRVIALPRVRWLVAQRGSWELLRCSRSLTGLSCPQRVVERLRSNPRQSRTQVSAKPYSSWMTTSPSTRRWAGDIPSIQLAERQPSKRTRRRDNRFFASFKQPRAMVASRVPKVCCTPPHSSLWHDRFMRLTCRISLECVVSRSRECRTRRPRSV